MSDKIQLFVGKLKSRTEISGKDDVIFVDEPDFKGRYMNRMADYAGKNLILQKDADHYLFGVWKIHNSWLDNIQEVELADSEVALDKSFNS